MTNIFIERNKDEVKNKKEALDRLKKERIKIKSESEVFSKLAASRFSIKKK